MAVKPESKSSNGDEMNTDEKRRAAMEKGKLIPTAWMEHSRIPKRYWEAECDSLQFAFYNKSLPVNYLHGHGLLLIGRNGVGKTYAACGLLKEYLRLCLLKNFPPKVMFITAPDLVHALSPGGKTLPFDTERTVADVLWNRTVLAIDDLGHEYRGSGTGFAELGLLNLLRYRVQEGLVTIITTNLNKDQLRIQYGEGFVSLLAEGMVPLEMKGDDLRKKRRVDE